jgi:hypothetical protein
MNHLLAANHKDSLDLARSHIESGEEEKARELALKASSLKCNDSEVLRGWGEVCEELGMARQALERYRAAIRLAPENHEVMLKLALLLNETGHSEESAHYLRKVLNVQPDHAYACRLLAEHYRELGLEGQAAVLVPTQPAKGPAPLRCFPQTFAKRDVETFLRLFSGKELGCAIQRMRLPDGAAIFDLLEKPLTAQLILSHLRGETTVAAYPLRSDNTARYAAVAIRARSSIARANQKNPSYARILAEKAKAHLLFLAKYAARLGIPAYPEDCGGICWRLWFFFEGFSHFLKIRRLIIEFMEHAPVPDGWLAVEPVLATRPAGLGWEENPVLLPLGVHRATLRRCFFLDSEGEAAAEQLKFLHRIRQTSLRRPVDLAPPAAAAKSGTELRISVPQAIKIYRGCAVIAELVERAFSGRNLRHEEKLVIFYSCGVVEGGVTALHEIFENCPDYDFEKVDRQSIRLKPNPISCLKIRKLLPEIASSVRCDCVFDLRGGKYPSPVMHENPHLVPAALETIVPSDMPLRKLVERYISLRQHQEEMSAALLRLEALMDQGFRSRGLDRLKVGKIGLRRIEEKGESSWELEQR